MINYKKVFGDYWNPVDEKIVNLIKRHVQKEDMILEVGFASGHYLAALADDELKMTGVEIREDVFENTKKQFELIYPQINLIKANILEITGHYNMIYSTGLLQCLSKMKRNDVIQHISEISDKVIFVVPKIDFDRNIGSHELTGVEGCEEYKTSNISYELSRFYGYVESGLWKKNEINLSDDFCWFYCDNPRVQ